MLTMPLFLLNACGSGICLGWCVCVRARERERDGRGKEANAVV